MRTGRIHTGFQRQFERLRTGYVNALEITLARRSRVLVAFAVIMVSGAVLLPFVGRDFFPDVDTGQFRLHVRAPVGTRIEETEQTFASVEATIAAMTNGGSGIYNSTIAASFRCR